MTDWKTDQLLIKEATKIAKEIFPNGFNKIQLCAIGKRLHEKLDYNAEIINEDVVRIKQEQAKKAKEAQTEKDKIKEEIIKRNQFKCEVLDNGDHYLVTAYDYKQFKKIIIEEVLELIENDRDYSDKNIVGSEERVIAVWNKTKYSVHVDMFWEKGENWTYEIKDESTDFLDKGWNYRN